MTADETSLFHRIETEGAAALVTGRDETPRPDVAAAVEQLRVAVKSEGTGELEAWDRAGALHDLDALDTILATVLPSGFFSRVSSGRRRFRDSARRALRDTSRWGTLALAAAVLGAVGDDGDAARLRTVGVHPAFTLHVSTALANLGNQRQAGRAALLQLLHETDGAARVIVIDRLFCFLWEPAVRIALVRDAVHGLDPEHAREVAGDIARICAADDIVDDPDAPEEMREGARLLLELAGDLSE